jgi:hypothetical protein
LFILFYFIIIVLGGYTVAFTKFLNFIFMCSYSSSCTSLLFLCIVNKWLPLLISIQLRMWSLQNWKEFGAQVRTSRSKTVSWGSIWMSRQKHEHFSVNHRTQNQNAGVCMTYWYSMSPLVWLLAHTKKWEKEKRNKRKKSLNFGLNIWNIIFLFTK